MALALGDPSGREMPGRDLGGVASGRRGHRLSPWRGARDIRESVTESQKRAADTASAHGDALTVHPNVFPGIDEDDARALAESRASLEHHLSGGDGLRAVDGAGRVPCPAELVVRRSPQRPRDHVDPLGRPQRGRHPPPGPPGRATSRLRRRRSGARTVARFRS